MPVYNAAQRVLSCALGESVSVWSAETPTPGVTGAASIPVALVPLQGRYGFSVSGVFGADPGMFQIDVQYSAANSDGLYQVMPSGTITVSDPTTFTFSFYSSSDFPFVRLYMRNRTNAVAVGALISRY